MKTTKKERKHKVREMKMDGKLKAQIGRSGLQEGTRIFRMGDCKIFLSQMPATGYYHMSISTETRYPTWDEVVQARYELIPGNLTMAMILPPLDDYINVHDYCFQLHQEGPLSPLRDCEDLETSQVAGVPSNLPTALGGQGRMTGNANYRAVYYDEGPLEPEVHDYEDDF